MDEHKLKQMLEGVRAGTVEVDKALAACRMAPFVDLGYARVDTHRSVRQGVAEVIYGEGKTAQQIVGIASALRDAGQECVLITRMDEAKALEAARALHPFSYDGQACLGIAGDIPQPDGRGTIAVVCAGTSDLPVAREAVLTARALGNEVDEVFDAGVAGIHRLLSSLDRLQAARVIIAVAGMEGALPSVVGGLVSCPVIAVPTSVGYGASLGGLAALLGMLNTCASGVSVVNIDNGFGAAYQASLINHLE